MKVTIIGVAGGTGSGKSTLVKRLQEAFAGDLVATLCHDYYYKSWPNMTYEERTKLNYDHPQAFDTEMMVEHIKALKNGVAIERPVYSFVEHNRTDEKVSVLPSKVIIVDGILIFENKELRDLMDIKVFVDTLAHSICELKLLKRFTASITPKAYTTRLNKLKKDALYSPEMDKTSDLYIEHLTERAMQFNAMPYVAAEVRVDYSDYAPEGFGTCDCIMIYGDTIIITDYKHGKGVPVSAEENSQMKLYALGALKKYKPIYGDTIKKVIVVVEQPRLSEEPSMWEITVDALVAWGESIKPIAEKAFMGLGEFVPGEHCKFCRGKAQCRARAEVHTALEEFKDCVPLSSLTPEQVRQAEIDKKNGKEVNVLLNSEIGDLLIRGKDLVAWYKDLEEYALKTLLDGKEIPGWKAVEGRSNRTFSDADAAIKAVIDAGYDEALVYERKAKTLTELEKLMGKTEFAEKVGQYIIKPAGKPTLATMNDKRPPYNTAAADFAGVAENENN